MTCPFLVGPLELSPCVYPIILDRPFMEGGMRTGALRWRFLLQCLENLHRSLQALGSRLYVLQGPYQGTVRCLVAQWGVTQLSMDTEIEPHTTPNWTRSSTSWPGNWASTYTPLWHICSMMSRAGLMQGLTGDEAQEAAKKIFKKRRSIHCGVAAFLQDLL
ncbi:cryptochrome-2-like [Salmo trutta]|uniref:cryptochrome-2-like n=1 Tax=Salmo trutta TaxID=8032 RepID=UPI00112FE7D9|nr:cryptochrome-2-like [Salmo trutta]